MPEKAKELNGAEMSSDEIDRLVFCNTDVKKALIENDCCFTSVTNKEGLLKDFSFYQA